MNPNEHSTQPSATHRRAYTREEAIAKATAYLTDLYGKPKDLTPRARAVYHANLGVIVGLFHEMFPDSE